MLRFWAGSSPTAATATLSLGACWAETAEHDNSSAAIKKVSFFTEKTFLCDMAGNQKSRTVPAARKPQRRSLPV
ncbi:hypothetical protein [Treponema sp. R8-4-B8]